MSATSPTPGRRPHPVPEFFAGVATLGRGFGYWRHRSGVMALGLIPAALVFAALAVLIGLLVASLDPVTLVLTGFASGWDAGWRTALRIAVGLALVIGLIVLAAYAFTALTLMVGDWFYGRIWRTVEDDLGGFASDRPEPGFWRANADAARLVVRAVFTGLLLVVIGLIPVVGTAAAAVLGVILSGRIVALELTTRPFAARGLTRRERRAALKPHRARTLGFGVAVQLCFFVPAGAIIVMPAAVAGATVLARHALGEPVRD